MYQIVQKGVNSSCLRVQTLRKEYTDFTQPLTQDDTVQAVDECVVYAVIDMVWYHPGWAAPLMFASSLLKVMFWWRFKFVFAWLIVRSTKQNLKPCKRFTPLQNFMDAVNLDKRERGGTEACDQLLLCTHK